MLYFSQLSCSHRTEMVLPNDDDEDDDDDNVDLFVSSAFICVDVLQFVS